MQLSFVRYAFSAEPSTLFAGRHCYTVWPIVDGAPRLACCSGFGATAEDAEARARAYIRHVTND